KSRQQAEDRSQRAEGEAAQEDGRIKQIKTQRAKAEQAFVILEGRRPGQLAVGPPRQETHEQRGQQGQEQEEQQPEQAGTAGEAGTEPMSANRERLAELNVDLGFGRHVGSQSS